MSKQSIIDRYSDVHEVNVNYPFDPSEHPVGQVDVVRTEDDSIEFYNVAEDLSDLPRTFSRLEEALEYANEPVESVGVIVAEDYQVDELRHLARHYDGPFNREKLMEDWEDPGFWSPVYDSDTIVNNAGPNGDLLEFTDRVSMIRKLHEV